MVTRAGSGDGVPGRCPRELGTKAGARAREENLPPRMPCPRPRGTPHLLSVAMVASGGCRAAARGWGTHAAPGRARSRQAPARSRAATRTDAPAARPRRAAPRPAVAASWVAPAGVPTPQPSQVSRPPPSLPCPAQPAAASFPKTKQLATWPAPLQVSRLLYSPAEQTLGILPCFFQFIQAWYFFPAMSTLSPAEMSKVGSRWGRERGKGHTCAPGAPLILLFCLLGENRALCVAGYQISIK